MPVSARSSGNCEYGSVMQAIWKLVGFLSCACAAASRSRLSRAMLPARVDCKNERRSNVMAVTPWMREGREPGSVALYGRERAHCQWPLAAWQALQAGDLLFSWRGEALTT